MQAAPAFVFWSALEEVRAIRVYMLIPLCLLRCLLHTTCKQTRTHACALKCPNRNSNRSPSPPSSCPPPRMWKWKLGIWRGWLQEIKTCLIARVTNGDTALRTVCPLIGLCHSLHLKAHVILTNPPPKHKQANPDTRLRGWGGMKERPGRSEGCSSGGEKEAPESDASRRSG